LVLSNQPVTLFDPLVDPFFKRPAHQRVDDVDDVLARELLDLLGLAGKGLHHLGDATGVLHHMLDGQLLEMGNVQVLDVLGLDHGAPTCCQVTQVPDGDVVGVGEVGTAVTGEEAVGLDLVLVLGRELGGGDVDDLVDRWLEWDLVGLRVLHNCVIITLIPAISL